mmetsp:Transcript_5555/g.12660  ORF Transcript_5555/g.12660 Transcript_5555/m.12660 type:complete len:109 (-) Transcript_5555:283-609(-)|eukprot:CAMPEP_0172321310 /NCGR_PEP_ID=MMETSP1058-20130122/43029_1 /TAXON_ID=83371 /ORGANISM="Detonula confervacea, Strain CCMP 353" /LENGTH=108 /DNA_ID=CAMNT_0013036785 /DNA_START=768 /DNA_END=1094 /DNA_ORIENTATION=+
MMAVTKLCTEGIQNEQCGEESNSDDFCDSGTEARYTLRESNLRPPDCRCLLLPLFLSVKIGTMAITAKRPISFLAVAVGRTADKWKGQDFGYGGGSEPHADGLVSLFF